jgi:hypothetical protein
MSAPNFAGFYKTGDIKVLSIARIQPFALQILATSAMSVHFKVGFVGDSIQTIFVLAFIEFLTLLRSDMSTMSHAILVCGVKHCLKYL